MIGRVLKKHGGFYNVANDGQIYECKLSGKQKYKQKDYIVAGDFVEFDFDEGCIDAAIELGITILKDIHA